MAGSDQGGGASAVVVVTPSSSSSDGVYDLISNVNDRDVICVVGGAYDIPAFLGCQPPVPLPPYLGDIPFPQESIPPQSASP